jgi:hypothetical protein
LTEAAYGCLKPPPTGRLQRVLLHLLYSMTISRLLDTTPGGAVARTGLRMMPTFPLLPLKFRRADFLRYGFKAGRSDGAFPSSARSSRRAVCVRPACPSLADRIPRSEPRDKARLDTSVRAVRPLYPRGPRSGPGYSVPAHPHLIDPIRPTRRHNLTSPQRLIRVVFAVHRSVCSDA